MTVSPCNIRNYRPSDFDNLVSFFRAEFPAIKLTSLRISGWLASPGFSPEQDLFVAEDGERIVGYLSLKPELGIHRVVLACRLCNDYRRKGLSGGLLRLALNRARELGARLAHVDVMEDNKAARKALEKHGFKPVRRYYELRLDMSAVDLGEAGEAKQGCRHILPGEESLLAEIQNRSFANHWGYNPNSEEAIRFKIGRPRSSPEDVWLEFVNSRIAGFCWTEVTGNGEGRILMIGTDPDFRGLGIGRKTLYAGLLYLKNKGVHTVFLTVDMVNENAIMLYDLMGFERNNILTTYEKQSAGIDSAGFDRLSV